ncbi:MAG: replicative DNA helicase [Lachnospiraceae bacterium]|nr:replicative DNA helicase [Lachnospiraceae bacterium]
MSDEIKLTKQKPSSQEAEQAVIGSMIIDRDALMTAVEGLSADDFYYTVMRMFFVCISELYASNSPIDEVTLINKLNEKDGGSEYANPSFLAGLVDSVPVTINIEDYVRIVKEKSLLRQIIKTNENIEKMCYEEKENVDKILDYTEADFLALLQKRGVSDFVPIDKVVRNAIDKIQDSGKQSGPVTGISTGFIDLDYMMAGLQDSDLILIAARPSMGKTAFTLNIAQHVGIFEDKCTAIFSLEMSKEQLVNRLLALESHVDAQKIRTGKLLDNDWEMLVEGATKISASKLIIDDTPSISVSELRSKCRKYKQEHGLSLVMIDYLQLMKGSGRTESRQQEISDISRSLKAIARELNVPVIALSQLNRGVEQREDKRPMLSDLRDSGAIEQDADVVMFIYRDDYYNKDSAAKGISEIIIAKQRNGPVGTVQLAWLPEYTKFANLSGARNKEAKD